MYDETCYFCYFFVLLAVKLQLLILGRAIRVKLLTLKFPLNSGLRLNFCRLKGVGFDDDDNDNDKWG
jgi:hypothetical protein